MDTNKMRDLKVLAEAAPSGPWLVENDSMYFKDDGYTRHMLDADSGMDVEEDKYCAALAFIAAANPATVLALLAEIERLCEANERVCTNYNRVSFASEERGNERDQLKAENEALRQSKDRAMSLVDQLEIQHAELKAAVQALELDAERYRFVRNPIGTSSPLAIWNEGKMPLFSGMADAVVDEFMAKEASHD